MRIGSELRSLRALTAQLPFDLDDSEKASQAFVQWRRFGGERAKRIVALWTYCFVRRYYLQKFAREVAFQVSDFDELVADTFRKIEQYASTIEDPRRYAQWVSVVCKNSFINYVRIRRRLVPYDATRHDTISEPAAGWSDFGIMYQALSAAIARLPSFLQAVAQLRFMERQSYEEISRLTGKPLPVVRSYASKVLARFRRDQRLRAYFDPVRDDVLSK